MKNENLIDNDALRAAIQRLYSPKRVAAHAARLVFRRRGNHSEAHLSEIELAAIIEAAVQVALEHQKE